MTVYRFKLFDEEKDMEMLAPRFATGRAISLMMDDTLIAESAQIVDSHCVDRFGFLDDGHFQSGEHCPTAIDDESGSVAEKSVVIVR